MNIRYDSFELYKSIKNIEDFPCIIYGEIKKTRLNNGECANWHESPEIQLCTHGCGYVIIDGEKYNIQKDSAAVVNANQIHYTCTESEMIYYPLIIDTTFCKSAGIDLSQLRLNPVINSEKFTGLFRRIINIYNSNEIAYQKAKLQTALLELLIEIAEHYSELKSTPDCNIKRSDAVFSQVKCAAQFIREHYSEKLSLEYIAKNALTDRYRLSRNFKELTGQTVVEFINNYRCERVKELLRGGASVSATAAQCGFSNMSFFTKTFRKYTGRLPSDYKRK